MIRFKACFRMTMFIFIKREDQSCDQSHDSFHHVIPNPPFKKMVIYEKLAFFEIFIIILWC